MKWMVIFKKRGTAKKKTQCPFAWAAFNAFHEIRTVNIYKNRVPRDQFVFEIWKNEKKLKHIHTPRLICKNMNWITMSEFVGFQWKSFCCARAFSKAAEMFSIFRCVIFLFFHCVCSMNIYNYVYTYYTS